MQEGGYWVPGYEYSTKKFGRHVQEHLIDHHDTIRHMTHAIMRQNPLNMNGGLVTGAVKWLH